MTDPDPDNIDYKRNTGAAPVNLNNLEDFGVFIGSQLTSSNQLSLQSSASLNVNISFSCASQNNCGGKTNGYCMANGVCSCYPAFSGPSCGNQLFSCAA